MTTYNIFQNISQKLPFVEYFDILADILYVKEIVIS